MSPCVTRKVPFFVRRDALMAMVIILAKYNVCVCVCVYQSMNVGLVLLFFLFGQVLRTLIDRTTEAPHSLFSSP